MIDNKPQPLDLKNIEEKIIDELNEQQPHDLETEIKIFKRVVLQRLKSACEFFLRYLDNPYEFILEADDEYIRELKKSFPNIHGEIDEDPNDYPFLTPLREMTIEQIRDSAHTIAKELCKHTNFDEWLFKLAFKDVLGDD